MCSLQIKVLYLGYQYIWWQVLSSTLSLAKDVIILFTKKKINILIGKHD